jgi:spore maturation protein SpmB
MLCVVRLLEASGFVDWLIKRLQPLLGPFGLTGLSLLSALQVNLVSFAAPVATLAIMDRRGSSDRHLAATLAMILAMAQANLMLPLTTVGLDLGLTMGASALGGLIAAASTYHIFGRSLCAEELPTADQFAPETHAPKGILGIIQQAGAEAFKIAVGAIPLLALALVAVALLTRAGGFEWITSNTSGLLDVMHIDPVIIVPTLTTLLAGGTAVLGVLTELRNSGAMDPLVLNQSGGWLIQSLNLPGVAILASAGPRVAAQWKPAVLGAMVGVTFRTIAHLLLA